MAPLTIGLLIDWLDNDYADTQAFAFFDEVCGRGFRFLCFVGHELSQPGEPEDPSNLAFRLASARAVDALIVMSLNARAPARFVRDYIEQYRPLPICTLTIQCDGIPHVSADSAAGIREAVDHLIGVHGKRRVAFVRGPAGSPDAERRLVGYEQALALHGLTLDPALVTPGDFTRRGGAEAVRLLCDERGLTFDALVAANDAMAAGALPELARRGLRVPQDVAVVGFDDVEDSRFSNPPISSVRQPWRALARAAVDALLEQRAGRAAADRQVPTEFVPRGSCGCGVTFERVERASVGAFSRRVANWDWRKATAAALGRELSQYGLRLDDAPARALVECFWQEVDGEREGGFVLLLDHELAEQINGRTSVAGWYHALARLRLDMLDRLDLYGPARA